MRNPLDSPINPETPQGGWAQFSRTLEYLSIAVLLVGILFKLQSWPFATPLWLCGILGLVVCYAVLFPVRLVGLRDVLGSTFWMLLLAGVSLGLVLLTSALAIVMREYFYISGLAAALPSIKWLAGVGVLITYFYGQVYIGSSNTLQNAISGWLKSRQLAMLLWLAMWFILSFA